MESKDELNEIDIKNRTCCYFDGIMRASDIDTDTDFSGILLDDKLHKEKPKYFNLTHFIQLQQVQDCCILGTIKLMNLLKFVIKLDI